MKNVVKIGTKGRHLLVPDGWYVVASGTSLPGDMFADVGNPNAPFWRNTEEDWDTGVDAEIYECLIRRCPTSQHAAEGGQA